MKDQWTYKGHTCIIELLIEYDEDGTPEVEKAWNRITKPDGTELIADISPYETIPRSVELWIDLGYPPGPKGYNFTLSDLLAMDATRNKERLAQVKREADEISPEDLEAAAELLDAHTPKEPA